LEIISQTKEGSVFTPPARNVMLESKGEVSNIYCSFWIKISAL